MQLPIDFERAAVRYPVRDFSGLYSIDQTGCVFSDKTGKAISVQKTKRGYHFVHLWKGGKVHSRFVHRLLLQSATNDAGEGKECNHKDGDIENNSIANLEWATSSENKKHAHHVLGRIKRVSSLGVGNPNNKPIQALDDQGVVVWEFQSMALASSAGFKPASIAHAIKGVLQKKHRGLSWRYAISDSCSRQARGTGLIVQDGYAPAASSNGSPKPLYRAGNA